MIPMCSRSVIRDDISQQISPKFPLYSRGVDRTRFEYAVFLLNKNVEQVAELSNRFTGAVTKQSWNGLPYPKANVTKFAVTIGRSKSHTKCSTADSSIKAYI